MVFSGSSAREEGGVLEYLRLEMERWGNGGGEEDRSGGDVLDTARVVHNASMDKCIKRTKISILVSECFSRATQKMKR